MYRLVDFTETIKEAWKGYDPDRKIRSVTDISAMVSTNHVFRVKFFDGDFVIAKISYFGTFKHFKEDHTIINVLANKLEKPFNNFLAKSLTKKGEVYTFRYKHGILDAWIVFYNPITIDKKLPARLQEKHIRKLGSQLAAFHKSCSKVVDQLPASSKTLKSDLDHLRDILETDEGRFEHRMFVDEIRRQCDTFTESAYKLGLNQFEALPVFVDWNIGNFSVTDTGAFFSRWDYDWFRISTRVMEFYFFSRVASSVGDKTIFSYVVDPLMEDRFIWFLSEYHKVFPLTRNEIEFMKEAYRFFILNYVLKDGRYFFHQIYANRLHREAFEVYFPRLDQKFNTDAILRALDL